MKILYAIQATGNGHISRAMELLPHIQQRGEVDIFLSGNNSNLQLDAPIKYRSKGLSLYYTCSGGLDYGKIARAYNPLSLKKEIRQLPVEKYDLVINDYDYITSRACRAKGIKSVNFGHQASFMSAKVPRPAKLSRSGEWLLRSYATADRYIGLHFEPYDNFIITPVIKKDITDATPVDNGHISVYLPSYCEPQLKNIFSRFKDFHFEIFSRESSTVNRHGNITFIPVDKKLFNKSLITCHALITGGGFETPSEALHLGKKLMAIPIRGQYEQCCNAAALQEMGVLTLPGIGADFAKMFDRWQHHYQPIQKDYNKSIALSMERLFEVT